jgi:hypothetical protein
MNYSGLQLESLRLFQLLQCAAEQLLGVLPGTKFKERSLIFGIVGFFFLGIVFGPLAILNAKEAEAMHDSATFGKVLGWIATISGIFWLLIFLLTFGRSALFGD